MMSWSTSTPDPNAEYEQRPPANGFFDSVRGSGWYRAKPRVIGGVCAGISARQGWDLSLVRVLVAAGAFFMPVVALAYGLAWLLLPEAEDGRIHIEETLEGRFDVAVIGGVLMMLASISSVFSDVSIFGVMGIGWFRLIVMAAGLVAIMAIITGIARTGSQGTVKPRPQYGTPQFGAPQFGVPQFGASTPGFDPKPVAVGLTRAFGAAALVGALLIVVYGWLTWASFEPKTSSGPRASVNGWGQVFEAGEPVDLGSGASGAPYAGVFLPLFVLTVAVLGLLILCNIGRFGNSIAVFVLSVLHLLLAIIFLAAPSICILFESDIESEVFEATNNFSTGPGAVLATLTLLLVTGTSLAGIVLGRRKEPVQAPTYGYQPY